MRDCRKWNLLSVILLCNVMKNFEFVKEIMEVEKREIISDYFFFLAHGTLLRFICKFFCIKIAIATW